MRCDLINSLFAVVIVLSSSALLGVF